MIPVYIGIGSNCEPAYHVHAAVVALAEELADLACSPVYASDPVGFEGPVFYNLVVRGRTYATLTDLVARLRALEGRLGRQRPGAGEAPANRRIDLDLLLYGDDVASEPVALPRDDIHRYAFVVRPLADLAPAALEPATGESFAEVWAGFPPGSEAGLRPVALALPCAQV